MKAGADLRNYLLKVTQHITNKVLQIYVLTLTVPFSNTSLLHYCLSPPLNPWGEFSLRTGFLGSFSFLQKVPESQIL